LVIKSSQQRYFKSEKGKLALTKYQQSKKGKLTIQRYRKSKLGKLKHKNRVYICKAVKNGKLIKKGICSKCSKKQTTEFHHIKYHDPPQLKDILELCRVCHHRES